MLTFFAHYLIRTCGIVRVEVWKLMSLIYHKYMVYMSYNFLLPCILIVSLGSVILDYLPLHILFPAFISNVYVKIHMRHFYSVMR